MDLKPSLSFWKSVIVLTIIMWTAFFWAMFLKKVSAYNYTDDKVQLTILPNQNWELTLDNITYHLDRYWVDVTLFLKVYGPDICYWLFEINDQLNQINCN
jgi:hypothetical protein